jgi:hypothetical protein
VITFQSSVVAFCGVAMRVSTQGKTSGELPTPDKAPLFGARRRDHVSGKQEWNLREVSAYSKVCLVRASKTSGQNQHYRKRQRVKVVEVASGQKSRCYRRACNLPVSPRSLAASCTIVRVSNSAASERTR